MFPKHWKRQRTSVIYAKNHKSVQARFNWPNLAVTGDCSLISSLSLAVKTRKM